MSEIFRPAILWVYLTGPRWKSREVKEADISRVARRPIAPCLTLSSLHSVMTTDRNLHFSQSIAIISQKPASLSISVLNNKKTPPSDGGAKRGIEEESARALSLLKLRLESEESTIPRGRYLGLKRNDFH